MERGAARDGLRRPALRPAMDLEGVKRWLPADKQGYADLAVAMREQGS